MAWAPLRGPGAQTCREPTSVGAFLLCCLAATRKIDAPLVYLALLYACGDAYVYGIRVAHTGVWRNGRRAALRTQ